MAFVLLLYPFRKSEIVLGLSTILRLHTQCTQNSADTRRQEKHVSKTTIPQEQLRNHASPILGRRVLENKGLIQTEAGSVENAKLGEY